MDLLTGEFKRTDVAEKLPNIPPKPVFRISKVLQKTVESDNLEEENKLVFPGILKTNKAKISTFDPAKGTSFIGFQPTHLKLDINVTGNRNALLEGVDFSSVVSVRKIAQTVTPVDLTASIQMPTPGDRTPRNEVPPPSIESLRGYVELMDKFNEHNFIIYRGRTLDRATEYQSFMKAYKHVWGPIAVVVEQLEEFLTYYEINMAIISGPDIYELSKGRHQSISRDQIYTCIANVKEVESVVDQSIRDRAQSSDRIFNNAVVRIQALLRTRIQWIRFKLFKTNRKSAIRIQALIRRFLQRCKVPAMLNRSARVIENRFMVNKEKLKVWWGELKGSYTAAAERNMMGKGSSNPARTILYIPSITVAEYLRLSYEGFQALQNVHIAGLYQLADPDVTIIYVCPNEMADTEVVYQEKLLAMMGVSILPKRLFYVTPEMVHKLPSHISLSTMLWCSSKALRKIRQLVGKSRCSYMITATLGWADKRLGSYFNIPLMAAHPSVNESITNKSFMKQVLLDANVATPIGAHDIYSLDDMLVALSRLIASNLSINRWFVKLNCDLNNESLAYIDLKMVDIVRALRKEQHAMIHGTDDDYDPWIQGDNQADTNQWDTHTWFTKQNQLDVRKRLMMHFKHDLPNIIKISRKDIYGSWDVYLKYFLMYGGLIEAEPLTTNKGFVEASCFIEPGGTVESLKGVELFVDKKYQTQGFNYPQMVAPPEQLRMAMMNICHELYSKFDVVGYVTMKFLSFTNKNEDPKLWGIEARLGMGAFFGALGTVGQMCNFIHDPARPPATLPLSLIPLIPEGKFCTYIPMAVHPPLKASKDEVFFHQCKMHGVAFDVHSKVGTIFFLIDSIVSGSVSMVCVANTRRRAIEYAIQTCTFITTQFGADNEAGLRPFDNMTEVLKVLNRNLRHDKHCDSDVQILIG